MDNTGDNIWDSGLIVIISAKHCWDPHCISWQRSPQLEMQLSDFLLLLKNLHCLQYQYWEQHSPSPDPGLTIGLNVRSFTRNWCIGAAPALWEARLCPLTISIDPSWPSWKAKVPDSIPLLWHCWAQFCSQRHSGHSPTSPSQGQMIRIYIIHLCWCSPPYHWLDKAECKLGPNFWMTETDLNCRQATLHQWLLYGPNVFSVTSFFF